MPSPSIETPVAEYSQSILCSPRSPGVGTSVPTNHDSGAGQYSVIVTPCSHLPCAFLPGGGGTRVGRLPFGARPPTGAPPLELAARALTALAAPPTEARAIAVSNAANALRLPTVRVTEAIA